MNLITGATGLLGAHLAIYLLEQGEKVRVIYRSGKGIEKTRSLFELYNKTGLFGQLEWFEADITDVPSLEKAFANVEYVYHCAAFISFDPKDEAAMRKVNIEGTANVVNLSLAFGIKKLCHVSSIAALGDAKEGDNTITEETEWNPEKPHSDYAISKYGGEMELWRAQQEGLNVVVVIPGVILGPVPRQKDWQEGSGGIFETIEKGIPFYTLGTSGFVAVPDVVALMFLLVKSELRNQRFIAVAGNYSFRDITFSIADALGVKRPSINAKPWLTSLAASADWLLSFFGRKRQLFAETVVALQLQNNFSNEKTKALTGFNFRPIPEFIVEIARIRKGT
jgi:nucleoside-diphosphate-sugar epimerase